MLVPTGLEIEAVEINDGQRDGYRFAVLGDIEADPRDLFQLLSAKMRREVATRYVHRMQFGWQVTSEQRLVGRIAWDPDSDGRLLSMMTFEGFTLEARIKDAVEVVGGLNTDSTLSSVDATS